MRNAESTERQPALRALAAVSPARATLTALRSPARISQAEREKSTPYRAALSSEDQQVMAFGQTIAGRDPPGSQAGYAAGCEPEQEAPR